MKIVYAGTAERFDPSEGTEGSTSAEGEKPAGEPAPASRSDRLQPRVPVEHERDESVIYGLPSASRPGCSHGFDLAVDRLVPKILRQFAISKWPLIDSKILSGEEKLKRRKIYPRQIDRLGGCLPRVKCLDDGFFLFLVFVFKQFRATRHAILCDNSNEL